MISIDANDLTTGKQIYRVLKAAQLGCHTSIEVATMTGMPVKLCSALISDLIKGGLLKRNGVTKRYQGRGGEYKYFEAA